LHSHWYITSVGVDPELQGKGYGKLILMNQMGDLADECNMDVYLECAGAFNKAFYEKMGFEEVRVETLDDGTDGIEETVYLVVRDAK
jgi:ribosomal protein S18 acetylase RimI-like enzyme